MRNFVGQWLTVTSAGPGCCWITPSCCRQHYISIIYNAKLVAGHKSFSKCLGRGEGVGCICSAHASPRELWFREWTALPGVSAPLDWTALSWFYAPHCSVCPASPPTALHGHQVSKDQAKGWRTNYYTLVRQCDINIKSCQQDVWILTTAPPSATNTIQHPHPPLKFE